MDPKRLSKLGAAIFIPLMLYAIWSNGYWAEPDPPKIEPKVVIKVDTPAYTELEQELTVETIEEGETEVKGYEAKPGELDLLAACVEAEAGNQSLLGKRLVVDVILNRREDPNFPETIQGVIEDPGQFNVVASGAVETVIPSESTWMAIYAEMAGIRTSSEVLYFRTQRYSDYGNPFGVIGDHYFSGR